MNTIDQDKTLALQNEALRAYYDYQAENYNDCKCVEEVEENAPGDTMPLFIWREVHDAEGDPKEAARMIRAAIKELEAVYDAMLDQVETADEKNETPSGV